MNKKDKQILQILQSEFPLTVDPYKLIAKKTKISEKALLVKIKQYKKAGMIRRIGGIIEGKKLGFKSVLIAACIKSDLEKNVNFLNGFDNITHNYLRDDDYNVWFTFSAKTKKQIREFLNKLKTRQGIEKILVLPSEKTIKINAQFNIK